MQYSAPDGTENSRWQQSQQHQVLQRRRSVRRLAHRIDELIRGASQLSQAAKESNLELLWVTHHTTP